jgi:4-amino-4-deoxy-L-arabinose transferase-like glycosyltransferase
MQKILNSNKYLNYSLILLLISVGLRFGVAYDLPLTADEAHYALYALHLDWSYFDHPPMVGWLQSIVLSIGIGSSEFVLRIVPNVLHFLIGVALYFLSLRIYPKHPLVGFFAVILFEFSLMFQLMGIVMLPDTPLLLFTILSIFSFERACNTNQWHSWLLYGIFLGLMGLSKYTAILIALGYFLWILFNQPKLFLNIKLWFSAILAVIIISPVIFWNIENEWASFLYQIEHSNVEGSQWSWLSFFRAQMINVLSYGFFLFVGLWLFIVITIKKFIKVVCTKYKIKKEPNNRTHKNLTPCDVQNLIKFVVLIYFFVFVYSSAQGGHYLPHWVSLPFILLMPWLAGKIIGGQWQYKFEGSKKSVLAIGSIIILLIPFVLAATLLAGKLGTQATYEAWRGVIGWQESTLRAKQIIEEDSSLPPNTPIYVANWSEASRVAWYAHPTPVLPIDNRTDQFDFWFNSANLESQGVNFIQRGILLAPLNHDELKQAMNTFKKCNLLQKINYSKFSQNFSFGLWDCLP